MARKTLKPAGVNRHGIRIARPNRNRVTPVCDRKDLYVTREQAEGYAIFFRARVGVRETLRPYRCPGCAAWHLTKLSGPR